MEIKVVDGNLTKAMKVFKRKLQQEGLFRELKHRRHYEKPSVRRKRKAAEAERRLRKKMRRMQRW
jgi:small subunit ribosomal protein S21